MSKTLREQLEECSRLIGPVELYADLAEDDRSEAEIEAERAEAVEQFDRRYEAMLANIDRYGPLVGRKSEA